ncbi:MAG: DUF58 domain-containing protein [Lachnospiraceae bacterium]|nr:DUF58 domain-containing protein [Lachnospiraceae bacterium]
MTRKLLGHLLIVLAVGIWSVLYENYGLLLLFVMLLALPISFFVYNVYARKKIELDLEMVKSRIIKNDLQEIVIKINNKTLLPVLVMDLDIEVENMMQGVKDVVRKKVYTINRGWQTKTIVFRASCCGNIKVKIGRAYIYDIFRLTRLKIDVYAESVFPVIPQMGIIDSDEMPTNTAVVVESDVFSKVKKGEDVSEVFDIRPYVQGDRLNTVNWKISGKTDELIVKELSLPVGNGIVIMVELFDDGRSPYSQDYIDTQIETALTLSLKLIKELDLVHYIAWYDKENKCCDRLKVTKETSLTQIAAALLSVRIYSDGYNLAMNYYNEFYAETDAHIYYITTGFTATSLDAISYSQRNAIKKLLLVAGSEKSVSNEAKTLIAANDMYLHIVEMVNKQSLAGFEL